MSFLHLNQPSFLFISDTHHTQSPKVLYRRCGYTSNSSSLRKKSSEIYISGFISICHPLYLLQRLAAASR